MEEAPKPPRPSRSFFERVALRANYVAWDRATRSAVARVVKRLRPPPEATEAAAATATLAVTVDGAAAAIKRAPAPHQVVGVSCAYAGAAGAMAGVTVEAVRNIDSLRCGRLGAGTYLRRVAGSGARTGLSMSFRAASASSLQELAKGVARRTGSVAFRRVAASNIASGVAFATVEQAIDTVHLARGKIDSAEYGSRTAQTLGSTGGALGGIAAGAALGSAVPIIGTTIGAVVGGIIGGAGGSYGGRKLGDAIFKPVASREGVESPIPTHDGIDPEG